MELRGSESTRSRSHPHPPITSHHLPSSTHPLASIENSRESNLLCFWWTASYKEIEQYTTEVVQRSGVFSVSNFGLRLTLVMYSLSQNSYCGRVKPPGLSIRLDHSTEASHQQDFEIQYRFFKLPFRVPDWRSTFQCPPERHRACQQVSLCHTHFLGTGLALARIVPR